MPIYRSEWSGMGTISRRFTTCQQPDPRRAAQSQDDEYRDLEYYLSYVSNGLPISGRVRGHEDKMRNPPSW